MSDVIVEVCTDIILFKNLNLTYYKGNYDTFEAVRDEVNFVVLGRPYW
jgi:ATPase subunit of ABC transporter with duplicated ATPase domains